METHDLLVVGGGILGAACALVLRGALAGVVALLAYGLLGELVLAPQWAPATGWTIHTSAARLTGQGTISLARAALVVTLAFVLALRDTVVFPLTIQPLAVSDDSHALDSAFESSLLRFPSSYRDKIRALHQPAQRRGR